ncbi:MAG: hypothetical protein MJ221_04355 [Bacilli bacterium]|nr:hypothetical protein [Bacilli bacterium]
MVFNKYCEEQGFNMEGQELYERWYTFLYEETNIDDKEKHHIKHTYLNLK